MTTAAVAEGAVAVRARGLSRHYGRGTGLVRAVDGPLDLPLGQQLSSRERAVVGRRLEDDPGVDGQCGDREERDVAAHAEELIVAAVVDFPLERLDGEHSALLRRALALQALDALFESAEDRVDAMGGGGGQKFGGGLSGIVEPGTLFHAISALVATKDKGRATRSWTLTAQSARLGCAA